MSWGAVAIGAGTAIGGVAQGMMSDSGGGTLPRYNPVNIAGLDERVRGQSIRNLREGRGVEQEFRPEFAGLREDIDRQLRERVGEAGEGEGTEELRRMVLQDLMGDDEIIDLPELEQSPLQQAAFDQAMTDLEAGGELPREIQNLVARTAMGRAGADAMGTGIGRDITARDLGQTALGLRDQRLSTAAQLGTQQQQQAERQQSLRNAINQANQQLLGRRRQERQSGLGFLEDLGFRDFQMGAQAAFSTPLPQTGLDPASIADITIADRQAQAGMQAQNAAISAQQQSANNQAMSNIFGAGIGALGQYAASNPWGNTGDPTAPTPDAPAQTPQAPTYQAPPSISYQPVQQPAFFADQGVFGPGGFGRGFGGY